MYDGILEKSDGTFEVNVQIQDGVERSVVGSLKKAEDVYIETNRVMNGVNIDREDIPVYEEVHKPVIVRKNG